MDGAAHRRPLAAQKNFSTRRTIMAVVDPLPEEQIDDIVEIMGVIALFGYLNRRNDSLG